MVTTATRRHSSAKTPKATRPIMPPVYGISSKKEGMLRWEDICRQIERSHNYWICTTRADGRPHAMPVWGFWVDGNIFFGTGRSTVKGKNMARNPNIVVHLESGDDAVILECVVQQQPLTNATFRKRINAISKRKYKMGLMEHPESVLYRAQPRVIFAWREKEFPTSATKWVMESKS